MALVSDYEIFDMVNRMERAMEFLKEKDKIQELLEKVTAVQFYLERFDSMNTLMKHFKDLEKNIYVCKDMFTPEEAAKYLGVSLSHLYRLTSNNEIPSNEKVERLAREKAEELKKGRINSKTGK